MAISLESATNNYLRDRQSSIATCVEYRATVNKWKEWGKELSLVTSKPNVIVTGLAVGPFLREQVFHSVISENNLEFGVNMPQKHGLVDRREI